MRERLFLVFLAMAVISACAISSPLQSVPASSRQGYFSDPGDFWGVNFKPGQPVSGGALLESVAGPCDQDALENDLELLKRMPPDIPLRVLGFTDSEECSALQCYELSLRRAQVLNDWLLSRGVPKSRLSAPMGLGSERPVGDNRMEDGRAQNRRAYISYEDVP
ncbi:OmpA family protein [Lysobacter maris]|uniref:OmpA family protein n=1 Tax=Marilutibacter maris TaxID=1605891 RepID=A0A508A5I6_9GAMM|nr:OmpA family protein [Lysobacter maris]KAB8164379.1 OmpA family protein [Lysobacter maris]